MDPATTPTDINQIRDQLGKLQAAAAKRHKQWYRQPATFLSFVAIVASLITFLISQRSQDTQDILARKQQLETLLVNIVDLQNDFNNTMKTLTDPQQRQQYNSMQNTKRLILLEEAETLMDRLGDNVEASEYSVIANEMVMDSNFTKAEVCFNNELRAARDNVSKSTAYRFLGGLYFMPSPLKNFDLGRKDFQSAIDAMKSSSGDDYSKYCMGNSCEAWGWAEENNGFKPQGDKLLAQAMGYYIQLSPANPLRQWAVEALSSEINAMRQIQNQNDARNQAILDRPLDASAPPPAQ
jgi:hypothetical protein